jgi:hypothetical protein
MAFQNLCRIVVSCEFVNSYGCVGCSYMVSSALSIFFVSEQIEPMKQFLHNMA